MKKLLLERELAARLSRKSLAHYTRAMFSVIEPKTVYHHGWHIDAISEHLEAVSKFQIKKLIIMTPPRCMKSIITSVMWPSWDWLTFPEHRFLFTSYAQSVSMQDSIKCRDIIESQKYQEWFHPEWKIVDDQNTKSRFKNSAMGERIATSVDGVSTALGGDFIVGDDLISAKDCFSDTKRKEANDYWTKTMSTRGNNPEKHAHVLIMQRLHEKDPAGVWASEMGSDVEVLKLPAEYDPKIFSTTSLNFTDPRTEAGELLWKEHMTPASLASLRKTLGSMQASAQLQQDPKPADGGTFKRAWWKFYKERPGNFIDIVQFWDCAEEDGDDNDYSTGVTWGRTATGFYLLDIWRNKVKAPDLERAIKTNYDKWAPHGCSAVVIEKKSNGTAVQQNLLVSTTLPIIPFVPTVSKIVRASAATPTVEAGNCYLPEGASFVEDFISEHEKFPLSEHDDQVDTTSMMREYFCTRNISEPRVRRL